MGSIGWSLLEFLVPMDTWMRLELHALPQVLVWAFLLAFLGALAIAIVAVGPRTASLPTRIELNTVRRADVMPSDQPSGLIAPYSPRGGAGPRAPAASAVCPC